MSNTTNLIFTGLKIVSWIIFIGLCIDAGGLIINFIFGLINPELVGSLYQKLDLRALQEQNLWVFFGMYAFVLFVAILKAHLFYIVVRLIQKVDLTRPFNSYVSKQITRISYYVLSIGLISHIARQTSRNLEWYGYELDKLGQFWVDSQAYILMASILYLIAFIFKKGMELQMENDLTV
ncbi:Protein of unknown function [Muriicola jejuensis]|uniref:DUF2975 domain-containing protein n=1 Tax=Muriicola jejuensis TaxID=504488 RepID=A0A6P0UGV2_9FLAO|nr:DUF2975 domain-containing protein [Muriicola jejuensis]NER10403.1 DUF2975 domain-containing protein [Muriicola jejuensis]SMP00936.1 Protein of unknown function [Muriicola jejuensis]